MKTPQWEEDKEIQRILQIAIRTEELTVREFAEDRMDELIGGLLLHAIVYIRATIKLSVPEQQALIRTLNGIAEACEDQTDPIVLAIAQGDPVRLLHVMNAVAQADRRVDQLIQEVGKEKEKP
jgi:hypothetical protein